MSRVADLHQSIQALQRQLLQAIEEEFPVGSALTWTTNQGTWATGVVVRHGINLPKLYVRNDRSGKESWVDLWRRPALVGGPAEAPAGLDAVP